MSIANASFQLVTDIATSLTSADWGLCRRGAQAARGVAHVAFQDLRKDGLLQQRTIARMEEAAQYGSMVEGATGQGPPGSLEAVAERLTEGLGGASPISYQTSVIALYSRAMQALAHASFNATFAAAQRPADPLASRFVLRRHLDAVTEELDSAVRSLFATSLQPLDAVALSQQALSCAASIELSLEVICADAARVERGIEQLLADGRGTEAEASGRLATDYAATIRTAITLHAACLSLSLDLISPVPKNSGKKLVRDAAGMTFDSRMPDGLNVELHRIGEIPDGRLIDVRGLVVNRRAFRDSDGKLITHAQIRDPSSNATMTLAGVFANWAHAGMSPGAFIHATGTWRTQSSLNSQAPALEVNRLPLAKMAERSWLPAMLRFGGKWFPRWRNELQIDWGISPHLAADEAESVRQGAVELVYLSIVRR